MRASPLSDGRGLLSPYDKTRSLKRLHDHRLARTDKIS